MIVKVLQKHIDRGVRGSCEQCALALAIKDHDPLISYVSVSVNLIAVEYGDGRASAFLPTRKILNFIEAFDGGWESGVKEDKFRLMRLRNIKDI